MLGKLLTGEPVNSDRERYVKIVELLTSTIINKMDPVALLAHLVREGCLNDRDKQNIECAKRELGCIDATELLLCRVTRLKDDWFRGFMISLRCLGMEDLMSEVDPDYTKSKREFMYRRNEFIYLLPVIICRPQKPYLDISLMQQASSCVPKIEEYWYNFVLRENFARLTMQHLRPSALRKSRGKTLEQIIYLLSMFYAL